MRFALIHISRGVDGTPASPAIDHLGLAMLAGSLQHAGHEAITYDTQLMHMSEHDLVQAVSSHSPDVIGFALNYSNIEASISVSSRLATALPQAPQIAGGHYATFHADELLATVPSLSAVILAEGEQPLSRMALAGPRPQDWAGIAGTVVRIGGTIQSTAPTPPPMFDDLAPRDLSQLHHLARFPSECTRVAIEASRGCAHACRFCSIAAAQKLADEPCRRRLRSPESIADEIRHINDAFGLQEFWFMDADFIGPAKERDRILSVARAITSLKKDISLEIDTRASAVEPETIAALRDAGLERCFLGIESFDADTLRRFGKGTTPEANLQAINILERNNIRPILGMIMFHPHSTIEQLKRDHKILHSIGYEKTQMLFRLKKYRGSQDAGLEKDSDGKGVAPWASYGWEFDDPTIQELWNNFDVLRLQALDDVFLGLTNKLQNNDITPSEFIQQQDTIFHQFGEDVDSIFKQ